MGELTDKILSLEGQSRALGTVRDPQESMTSRILAREGLRESGINVPGVREIDVQSRERFLGEQLGGGPLGEPGMKDLGTRFDLGLSDTFAEKKTKFLTKFPEGDFIEANNPPVGTKPAGKTILFRKHSDERFSELDAPMLEKFELLGDFADISGDLPAIATELAITRGGGIVNQLLMIAAGNVAGDTVKEIMEAARGYQEETFAEQAKRIGSRSLIAVGGAGLTTGISGPINALRGSANLKLKPGAPAAQRAAGELGIPALLPSQIAASPIIQRLGRQAQATVSTLGDYATNQQKAVVQSLSRLRDRDALRFAAGDLGKLHDEAIEQITEAAKVSKTSLTKGFTAIQKGLVEYEDFSRAIVDREYRFARKKGTPEFNLNPALAVAGDIKAGTPALNKKGEAVNIQPPTPAIEREITTLENLDPSLPTVTTEGGREVTGTDQLRAIRSNLWSLKQEGAPPGLLTPEQRRTTAQAKKLYFAIDDVLKRPANADSGFVAAWARANREAQKRFDTLEKLVVIQSSKSETPAKMADRLIRPFEVDNLKILKETIGPVQYGVFQDAAKTDLIAPNNLPRLTRRLDTFDQPTLDALFSKTDQRMLRNVADQVDRLEQINFKGILKRQSDVAAAVSDLTSRSDTAGISELLGKTLPLAEAHPARRMIRAGIVDNLFNAATERVENVTVVNSRKFAAEVAKLRDNGLLSILSDADRRILSNVDEIVDFLASTVDAGTALTAATTAEGMREFRLSSFMTLLENIGTGRALTNPVVQKILIGSGKKPLGFASLRVLGAALAVESVNTEGTSTKQP